MMSGFLDMSDDMSGFLDMSGCGVSGGGARESPESTVTNASKTTGTPQQDLLYQI